MKRTRKSIEDEVLYLSTTDSGTLTARAATSTADAQVKITRHGAGSFSSEPCPNCGYRGQGGTTAIARMAYVMHRAQERAAVPSDPELLSGNFGGTLKPYNEG